MDSFTRMANLTSDQGGCDDMGRRADSPDASLRNIAKRATNISLPGIAAANTRSLFIFSDENFIRKYAKLIIEWGYPLLFYRRARCHRPGKYSMFMCLFVWCSCVCLFIVVLVNWLDYRVHTIIVWLLKAYAHDSCMTGFDIGLALLYWSTDESCNVNVAMRHRIQEKQTTTNWTISFP